VTNILAPIDSNAKHKLKTIDENCTEKQNMQFWQYLRYTAWTTKSH